MVLRLWIEPGAGLRVRITRTTDVESNASSTSYASTRPEVLGLVQDWLDEMASPLQGPEDRDHDPS
jgi:hypothetical protein